MIDASKQMLTTDYINKGRHKREERETDAVVRPTQAEARRTRHNQQTQQGTEAGNGNQQHRNGGSHIVVEEEDGLGLALGVLMTGFEGMRMHNDNSIHHM